MAGTRECSERERALRPLFANTFKNRTIRPPPKFLGKLTKATKRKDFKFFLQRLTIIKTPDKKVNGK